MPLSAFFIADDVFDMAFEEAASVLLGHSTLTGRGMKHECQGPSELMAHEIILIRRQTDQPGRER